MTRAPLTAPSKLGLRALADALLEPNLEAIDRCIDFVCRESEGHWHGRARAMMCRRLKHVALDPTQRQRLLQCILGRLRDGEFSEQFRDQLRLALVLDAARTLTIAASLLNDDQDHVRRYARWLVDKGASVDSAPASSTPRTAPPHR